MSQAPTYEAEKNYLKRKLPTFEIKWDVIAAMEQLASQPTSEADASNIISQLRDAFLKKAGVLFPKLVFSVSSKLRGGSRVIVSIPLLRQLFGDEIETSFSGGGRGLNPYQTNPRPPGGRGI